MSEKKEYTGSDVTEAISKACQELGVSQDNLQIEVVAVGSAGIFGLIGKKKAVVSVMIKKDARPAKEGKPARRPAPEEAGKPSRPRREERSSEEKRGGRRGEKREEGSRGPIPAPRSKGPEKPPAQVTAADLAAVKGDLEKLLSLMGLAAQVSVANEANKIVAKLEGGNDEEIIGPEGQTLDSLQYLMRKIIGRKVEGKVLFSLDVGSYREVRRDDLEEMALKLAEEVRGNGRTRSIPALNPAERRIVHMKLQDDPTIRSRSVGEGQYKKILIYLPGRGKKGSND
ncbi:MAG: single-stranded DNA-binding protein [Desulfobulbaceae bacterium]|nr:single-stranded DNA-binding protein [Desulfobulbaceae bacterium]